MTEQDEIAPEKAPVEEEIDRLWRLMEPPYKAEDLWNMVLTDTERRRLDNDLASAYHNPARTAGIWMRLRGVSRNRAVLDVAHRLFMIPDVKYRYLLRVIGESSDDPQQTIEHAVLAQHLVLREQPRAVYWEGNPINLAWEKRHVLWHFLWELARSSKDGRAVDSFVLGPACRREDPAKQKSRLTCLPEFPQSLAALIEGDGRHGQRLILPPECIRLFRVTTKEVLEEITA